MNNEYELLRLSTKHLYYAFRKLTPRHCRNLHSLTIPDLESLGLTDPEKPDPIKLKPYIPRVLELLITAEYPTRPEIVLKAISQIEWLPWDKKARESVNNFMLTGWKYLLSQPCEIERIDQWLCASAQVFEHFLDFSMELCWYRRPCELTRIRHFAGFFLLNADTLLNGKTLTNIHWQDREKQMLEITSEIADEYTIENFDTLIEEHQYEPAAILLRQARNAIAKFCGEPEADYSNLRVFVPSDFVRELPVVIDCDVPGNRNTEDENALDNAIATLYDTFSSYIPQSDYGISVGNTPLRELTQTDLADFARDILVPNGCIEDFKHFLPRIFELMLCKCWPVKPEGMLFKCLLADYRTWPKFERLAIDAYIESVWKVLLSDPNYPVTASEWMCGASGIYGNPEGCERQSLSVSNLYKSWCFQGDQGSVPALVHWAEFVNTNWESLMEKMQMRGTFWCDVRRIPTYGVHQLISGLRVSIFMRKNRSIVESLPEVMHAIELLRSIWLANIGKISGISNIAFHDPEMAVEKARSIPYGARFKSRILSQIAEITSDHAIRIASLREALDIAKDSTLLYRVCSILSKSLGVLVEFGMTDWLDHELPIITDKMKSEPSPFKRIQGLKHLIEPALHSSHHVYRYLIEEISRAADEGYGWKVALALSNAADEANEFDHKTAIEIAMMIRHLRTRRHVLRRIGEFELAERFYGSSEYRGWTNGAGYHYVGKFVSGKQSLFENTDIRRIACDAITSTLNEYTGSLAAFIFCPRSLKLLVYLPNLKFLDEFDESLVVRLETGILGYLENHKQSEKLESFRDEQADIHIFWNRSNKRDWGRVIRSYSKFMAIFHCMHRDPSPDYSSKDRLQTLITSKPFYESGQQVDMPVCIVKPEDMK